MEEQTTHTVHTQAQLPTAQRKQGSAKSRKAKRKLKESPDKKQTQGKQALDRSTIILIALVAFLSLLLLFVELARHKISSQQLAAKSEKKEETKTIAVTDDQLVVLQTAFISSEEVIDFIRRMEQAGTGFTNYDLSFDSDEPEKAPSLHLLFTIKVEGAFDSLVSFANALLDSPYAIEVERIQLIAGDEGEDAVLTINAKLFVSDSFVKGSFTHEQ